MNPPSYSTSLGTASAIPSKQNLSSLGRSLAHVFQHNNTQLFHSPATALDQAVAPSQQQQQNDFTNQQEQHYHHPSQQQQHNFQEQYHYSSQQQQQQQQQHIYTDHQRGLSSQHQHRSSALLYSEWPDDSGHNKHHQPSPQSLCSPSSQLMLKHNSDSTLISPASTPLLSSSSTSTTTGSLTTAITSVMSPELSFSQGSTSKRGASASAEPPRAKKARRITDEEEEEEESHGEVDNEQEKGEDELVVVEEEEEDNEFLPPWMFDDDDDEPVEVLSASGKPKSLEDRRTDWIVKQLNKPEVFLILQAPKQGTPRTTPKSRIFQQLANGINSWYAAPNQVQYTMKQVKTKVETIKASFKRGQDLVHKSGFGTTNPSKTWKQQVLKTSPHYFKLEANWSVAWSDLVQDYCDSTSNLDDKVIDDSPTRAAIKAARRRNMKANGSEIEQMVGEGIASDYSERDEDEDVLEARTMQELKRSGARAQKGKMVQKGKAGEKQAQKESPTTIYQRPSQRPLPKKSFTKVAPAGSSSQTSNTASGAQGSTSKVQIKVNHTHKSGSGGGGSDKMQSLADSIRATLESEKKNKEVELLIMKQRLALEESEAKGKAEARRASLALEERRIEIEAQRMNNEHILKMAQLQKEKDLEIYRMDLELRLGKGSTERFSPTRNQHSPSLPASPNRNTCHE